MSKKAFIILLLAFVGLVGVGGTYWYFRAHTENDAEDRRRWLREIDEENAKSGIVRDTNGSFTYVGTSNRQAAPSTNGAAK